MLWPIIARSTTLSCDVRGGVEGKSINGDENRATRARSPILGSCSLRVPPGLSADDGQPGSYQLVRWVSTEKRASSDRCMLARIRHLRFRAHVSSAVNVAQQKKGTMPRVTVGSVRPAARFDRMSACAYH